MSEGEWGELWKIGGMDIDSIGTRAGPSFLDLFCLVTYYIIYTLLHKSQYIEKIISHWRWHM